MKFNSNGLWKALIDKGMKKKDLIDKKCISSTTISKMSKGEDVLLTTTSEILKN